MLLGFVAPKKKSSNDGKLSHHSTVPVLQDMAMEHVRQFGARALVEPHKDFHLAIDQNSVFPSLVLCLRGSSVFAEHLKRHAMQMEWMHHHVGLRIPTYPDSHSNDIRTVIPEYPDRLTRRR